jgi:hypothetical protein
VEQLSLGARYVHWPNQVGDPVLREDFLGFVPLPDMRAATIADRILSSLNEFGVQVDSLIGQGYDGCSTMAGNIGGVQARIKHALPNAEFYHCASHRLNLVINSVSSVPEIRDSIAIIKDCIRFFRESPLRRQKVRNLPHLCETRWSEKYKSLRLFHDNFSSIVDALSDLEANSAISNTRTEAHKLLSALTSSKFLVALTVIAKYSALFEPVCNVLQGVQIDLLAAQNHITTLRQTVVNHRSSAEQEFAKLFAEIKRTAEDLNILIATPRVVRRQTGRNNVESSSTEEYFRRAVYIPYLDGIVQALDLRFNVDKTPAFHLMCLHPSNMSKLSDEDFNSAITWIETKFCIENLQSEAEVWRLAWKEKAYDGDLISLLKEATGFYPGVSRAVTVAATLPVTTCSVERSFSTLRRVKTWLRSTMTNTRLTGLCMMSLYRKQVDLKTFPQQVAEEYAKRAPRRLNFGL